MYQDGMCWIPSNWNPPHKTLNKINIDKECIRMVCAGFHLTGNEDPERCASLGFGDSGGPLVCR